MMRTSRQDFPHNGFSAIGLVIHRTGVSPGFGSNPGIGILHGGPGAIGPFRTVCGLSWSLRVVIIFETEWIAMAGETILAIEDEPDVLEVIEYNLAREGFEVLTSEDGEEGLEKIREEAPDLVLLDLMLPGVDGVEICRRIKSAEDTEPPAVIMVTAKDTESDVVLGLGVGADDYVTKPFSPKELVARVRAVLRRVPAETPDQDEVLERGELTIDPRKHETRVDGEPIDLTATEFRLLQFLASHPGRVFTRQQLVSRVIGEKAYVTERNIDVHVRRIREKLDDREDLIETVRGVGYRFLEIAEDP